MASPNLRERQIIAQDTVARSEGIIDEHKKDGASLDSTFFKGTEIHEQIEAAISGGSLTCPNYSPSNVEVINGDSFSVARSLMDKFPEESKGSTAVLNLASDELPGGGWLMSLAKTQEEALCYSSTLYATLKPCYYPWPNLGQGSDAGIYSPGVVIFKDDLDHACVDLKPEERRVVSVLTVAAPRGPDLTADNLSFHDDSDAEDLRKKIRLIYRMAIKHEQHFVVLGAMGCGVYFCPPKFVAEEMKKILLEAEFKGWFRRVVFAVYSPPNVRIGRDNYTIFSDVFKGVSV